LHIYRPNGITFLATPATTALSNKWQLKPGDVVTFKHKGFWLGSQKPKSPTIYRLRLDKTWDEVVAAFDKRKYSPTGARTSFRDLAKTNNSQLIVPTLKNKSKTNKANHKAGFWTLQENRRQFFIDLALSKGLDPFAKSTWDSITAKDIDAAKVRIQFCM
jgi:hypothetical protein